MGRAEGRTHAGAHARVCVVAVCAAALLGAGALSGCEGLREKFIRKPKGPTERPQAIFRFVDYSTLMTPVDRYRKHAMLFDYWSALGMSSNRKGDQVHASKSLISRCKSKASTTRG